MLLLIEIQQHGISSSIPLLGLLVSCTHSTLRELLPLSSVALLRFSYLWFLVASHRFCRTLLSPPHGRPRPQASSLINGWVAVSGNHRSSGPGGPATWYCTISWQHRSVWWARRKVVTSFQSSLSRTFWVASLVSGVSFPSLGYSYRHSPWWQPRAPLPSSAPPRGSTSFGRVVVLHCLGDSGSTWI